MAALVSKPGITSASVLAIPKNWSDHWFRSMVSNLLQGADVRNAVGASGITISGNIASPYATISFGGSGAPITNQIFISSTTSPAIQITNANTTTGEQIRFVAFDATHKQSYIDWFESDNTTRRAYLGFGNVNDETFIIDTDTATGILSLRTNATERFRITAAGALQGLGPNAGVLVDMTPDSGTSTATITGCTTAPTSTVSWVRCGLAVIFNIPAITGTSNANTLTYTLSPALPAAIRPGGTRFLDVVTGVAQDGGARVSDVCMSIDSTGATITFYRTLNAAGWTNTATTKGIANGFQTCMIAGL